MSHFRKLQIPKEKNQILEKESRLMIAVYGATPPVESLQRKTINPLGFACAVIHIKLRSGVS